MGVNLKGFL